MIRVWSDGQRSGVLDRLGPRGSTFAYDPIAASRRAVSMTMPVRVQSWDAKFGLLPVFEMNLPEGALRERLTRQFAKATGAFDDIDLLGVVGRTQIGRIRYSALDRDISEDVPFQSIDEILRARRDGGLFSYLLERFAAHSGLSGVQPKVLVRGTDERLPNSKARQSPSVQSATHIVKMWEEDEFPELAANEHFCLEIARRIGLEVPVSQLSDDGGALVVERFDLTDGGYLGFEDGCVLNGLGTTDKYRGGYETRLFRRIREFVSPANSASSLEALLKLFALNCAIRNGDAHLKNFGIVYTAVDEAARLAPVYDLVTTWAYIPNDPMALTLDGSTNWPDRAALVRLAQTRCDLLLRNVAPMFESIADAMSDTAPGLRAYFADREGEIGIRIVDAWNAGIRDSLGLIQGLVQAPSIAAKPARRTAASDVRILELLRQRKGRLSGTLKQLSDELEMPASTLAASLVRLAERGLVSRGRRSISLIDREV